MLRLLQSICFIYGECFVRLVSLAGGLVACLVSSLIGLQDSDNYLFMVNKRYVFIVVELTYLKFFLAN